jgi:3-deoxy-D-manno-octulosonic-acid transferase
MWVYNLVIFLYGFVIKTASIKKIKAKQWISGRKNWRKILSDKVFKLNTKQLLWIHCASYGEFEQGRPLIEATKKKYPNYKILVSFFSPSGYEAFKDWKGADIICYLPLDTKRNAKDFIEIVKPQTVIFIKYEFWLNFLFQLKEKNIPTFLVSAVFKPHHPFFKWYGHIFRKSLKTFNKLLLQDNNSSELLKSIGVTNYEVFGDTRYDRVLQIKQNFKPIPQIESFKGNNKLIIAGSTYTKDVDLLLNAYSQLKDKSTKLILVPHLVDEKSIVETTTLLNTHQVSYLLYTQLEIQNSKFKIQNSQVLVVNTMGLLSKVYYYADCAYIGGSFDGGLHNTLEAAVYGIPVVFYGDNYLKYNEAVDLIKLGAAVTVANSNELADTFNSFLDPSTAHSPLLWRRVVGETFKEKLNLFFESNANATSKVLAALKL